MAREKEEKLLQAEGPVGAFPTRGARKERRQDVVAKRIAGLDLKREAAPEGVQPLNTGFFALERIRRANCEGKKVRAKKRRKVGER